MTPHDDETLTALAREAFPASADPRDAMLARQIAAAAGTPRRPAPARDAIWTGLLAASFVAGIVAGPMLQGSGQDFVIAPGGRIADAGLVRVLDRRLASQGRDSDGRIIGLTFRDTGGRWCRTFVAGEAGVAGLACREGDEWAMRALAPATAPAGEVRTAGADIPAAILSAVDTSLAGETLDAAAEARARNAGWR